MAALFLGLKIVVAAENEPTDLASNEAIVTNFADLKTAISEDNGIDTVYLGADVELSGGIIIPATKKKRLLYQEKIQQQVKYIL